MNYISHIDSINELSASEGVFTTAQAMRMGIPRDALSHACKAKRLERIAHGAYKLAGMPNSNTDELMAIWKLTDPAKFSWERQRKWDGIAIGGTAAATLQNMGDFYLSPYRIYSPKRINSRSRAASFGTRSMSEKDVEWINGMPVTKPERTLVDLCLDHEDPSLIEDAFFSAKKRSINLATLKNQVESLKENPRYAKALKPLEKLI